jgi:alkyl hydroperoxide reductase subunit AhpC
LGGIDFRLLADFHPKGAVAQLYGVYNEERGTAQRALFIIDEQGVIRHSQAYEPGTVPDPEEIIQILSGL